MFEYFYHNFWKVLEHKNYKCKHILVGKILNTKKSFFQLFQFQNFQDSHILVEGRHCFITDNGVPYLKLAPIKVKYRGLKLLCLQGSRGPHKAQNKCQGATIIIHNNFLDGHIDNAGGPHAAREMSV